MVPSFRFVANTRRDIRRYSGSPRHGHIPQDSQLILAIQDVKPPQSYLQILLRQGQEPNLLQEISGRVPDVFGRDLDVLVFTTLLAPSPQCFDDLQWQKIMAEDDVDNMVEDNVQIDLMLIKW